MNTERLTRQQLVAALREHGFPVGLSTLEKLCAPKVGLGPPPACYWNKRPLYDLDVALAWAQARLRFPQQSEGAGTSRAPAPTSKPLGKGRITEQRNERYPREQT